MFQIFKTVLFSGCVLALSACGGSSNSNSENRQIDLTENTDISQYSSAELKQSFRQNADSQYTGSNQAGDLNVEVIKEIASLFIYDEGMPLIYLPRRQFNEFVWNFEQTVQEIGELQSQSYSCDESGSVDISGVYDEGFTGYYTLEFSACENEFFEQYDGTMYVVFGENDGWTWFYDDAILTYLGGNNFEDTVIQMSGYTESTPQDGPSLYSINRFYVNYGFIGSDINFTLDMEEMHFRRTAELSWNKDISGTIHDSRFGVIDVETLSVLDANYLYPENFGEVRFSVAGNRSVLLEFSSSGMTYGEDKDGDGNVDVGAMFDDLYQFETTASLEDLVELD